MKTYTKGDYTKAYQVRDGKEVQVPKKWLSKGSPYADAYTRTNPADAAKGETRAENSQQPQQ